MQVQHRLPIRIARLGVPDIGAVGQPDPKIRPHHRPPHPPTHPPNPRATPDSRPAATPATKSTGNRAPAIVSTPPLSALAQTDEPVLVPGR